jgi:hypothetical protein
MRALSWAQETRRINMMNECVAATTPEDDLRDAFYTETRTTDQQVKDAVYCWVLVNQPDIIRYAKELVAA